MGSSIAKPRTWVMCQTIPRVPLPLPESPQTRYTLSSLISYERGRLLV